MRRGVNPIKDKYFGKWPELLAVVITHLPNRGGYFTCRHEIISICIESIRKHAGRDIPLLVWDNGSDQEFKEWLVKECRPEYLFLSSNLGKPKARAAIFNMLPPKTVVSFSDDDMLFYPGWLDAHLELLAGFPNVGMVSGWPIRFTFGWGGSSAILFGRQSGKLEVGRFIPNEEEEDYALSVGMDPKSWVKQNAGKTDIRISYNGMQAYASAQHCQFVCEVGRLAEISKREYLARHQEIQFDNDIDSAGMLRLCTTKRFTFHMGNFLDEKLKTELRGLKLHE